MPPTPTNPRSRIALWIKLVCTALVGVLVPYYWNCHGLTNFLYHCDVALLMYLGLLLVGLPVCVFLPTHLILRKLFRPAGPRA
jgi:hypothetical protein